MKFRKLGKSELEVSEVGYGAWGIGGAMWQGSKDVDSIQALYRAFDLGINFVDTALVYGDGHSESLVGGVIKKRNEKIYVASKIPPKNGKWPAHYGTALREAFPYDHIIKSTETSLRNLRMDVIDLQQFHVWDDSWATDNEWKDAVSKLKNEGKIRYFGISINDHQPDNALKAAETGLVDSFQVIYNIFDQTPERNLFPLCQKLGIGIIVRVPLDEGGLTGKITPQTIFPEGDFRSRYFRNERKQQVYERTEKLKKLFGNEFETLPDLALRFCLNHTAVSTVIPGMRSVANVEMNCGISDGSRLGEDVMLELRKHIWERNFYS